MIGVTYKPISAIVSSACKPTEIVPSIVEEEDVVYFHFSSPTKKNISFADNVKTYDGNTNEKYFERMKEAYLNNKLINKKYSEALKTGRNFFYELQFAEALKIYKEVISELSKNHHSCEQLNRLLAISYILTGNVYHQLKDRKQAREYYKKGEELDETSIEFRRYSTHPGSKKIEISNFSHA